MRTKFYFHSSNIKLKLNTSVIAILCLSEQGRKWYKAEAEKCFKGNYFEKYVFLSCFHLHFFCTSPDNYFIPCIYKSGIQNVGNKGDNWLTLIVHSNLHSLISFKYVRLQFRKNFLFFIIEFMKIQLSNMWCTICMFSNLGNIFFLQLVN